MSGFQDPALYPGTDILRNKADLRDAGQLRDFEYRKTALREADAPAFPSTAQGFRDLHKHLLGDVYEWAGELRTVNLTKEGSSFSRASAIAAELDSRFQRLGWDNQLKGLSADRFATAAATHIAELNTIHPFREGNGRAMRLHLEQLAGQAGHLVDRQQFSKATWDAASVSAFNGSSAELARVIAGAMEPKERIGVEAAIGRVRELHGQAIEEIRSRTKEIRDLIQQGKGSTVTSRELTGLREEMATLGSPERNAITSALERHRAAGGREVTILTGPAGSARDQLNAIRQGADRAIVDAQREGQGVDQSARSAITRGASPIAATPAAASAGPAASSDRAKPAAYWSEVASRSPATDKPAAAETARRTYKAPKT